MATRNQMAQARRSPVGLIMQKFYVYDPGVYAGDEIGRLRVRDDDDDKGLYVLAPAFGVQYWIDQGVLGDKPVGELSGAGKKMLNQMMRGRVEKPDVDPKRVPRYDRATQSGAPRYAAQSAREQNAKRRGLKARKNGNGNKAAKPSTRGQGPAAASPPKPTV